MRSEPVRLDGISLDFAGTPPKIIHKIPETNSHFHAK